jgi:hypothetical protein
MITQTPKEKAEALVDSFMNIKSMKLSDYSMIYHPTAKQCALIAVNEILDVDCFDMSEEHFDNHIEYWQEVKQEIKKL